MLTPGADRIYFFQVQMQVINLYLSSNPSGPLVDSLLTWQRHSAGTLTDTRMIEQSISIKILFNGKDLNVACNLTVFISQILSFTSLLL